jgi:hypothetical protein
MNETPDYNVEQDKPTSERQITRFHPCVGSRPNDDDNNDKIMT